MNVRLLLASLPIAILCYTFSLVMPDTALWRNAGEYVVSAFYLNVSGPAGSPLLATLSNGFALLPLGPIAWRIHAAHLLFCILSLILAYRLSFYYLRHVTKLDSSLLAYFAVVPPLLLLGVPTFFKQAITIESHVLNTVGIQLLLLLYLRSEQTKDVRYLVTAAFFAGLFPGNQITIVAGYVPLLLLILLRLKRYASMLLPAVILFAFGLAVYSYVPLRALRSLPLNAGSAISLERFANLAGNRGISTIGTPATPEEAPSKVLRKEQKATLFLRLMNDSTAIAAETSVALLVLAAVGLALTIVLRPDFGFILLWILLSHWYFVKGWQADPWVLIFFFIAFLANILLALLAQTLSDLSSKRIAYSLVAALGAYFLFGSANKTIKAAEHAAASFKPTALQQQTLRAAPMNAIFLSDDSFSKHTYQTTVEGFRGDLALLSLQQLTNPEHSAPFSLQLRDSPLLNTNELKANGQFENIQLFLDRVASNHPVAFEPAPRISKFLAAHANLGNSGVALISNDATENSQQSVPKELPEHFATLSRQIDKSWEPFRLEAKHYLSARANGVGDFLFAKGSYQQAIYYYRTLCASMPCAPAVQNNLASALIKAGKAGAAAKILETLLEQDLHPHDFYPVQANLELAYEQQKHSSSQRQTSDSKIESLKNQSKASD